MKRKVIMIASMFMLMILLIMALTEDVGALVKHADVSYTQKLFCVNSEYYNTNWKPTKLIFYVDQDTGVMYSFNINGGALAPLYNADGTLKTIDLNSTT